MRRHEEERNQTRTRMFGHTNSENQNFDGDYSRFDRPDSDWYRIENPRGSRQPYQEEDRDGRLGIQYNNDLRPRGGDDLFRNNDFYTDDFDRRQRQDARLGLGPANHFARWIGDEGTGHYGKGPKGYKRSDDRIKEDASEALYRDQNIDATDIEVQVKDGTVILKGSVDCRKTKREAEHCVDELIGVEDVRNELTIKKSGGSSLEQSDFELKN